MNDEISFGYYSVSIDNPHDAKPIVDICQLAEALPHGSGLDYDYQVVVSKNGNVHVYTSYHLMDEDGCYCGNTPVHVSLIRVTKDEKHDLPRQGFYQLIYGVGETKMGVRTTSANGLVDYLYDVFHDALSEFLSRTLEYHCFGPHDRPARFVNGEWQEEK